MGGIYPILVLFNPFAYEFRQGLFYESRGSSLYCGADCYQTAHSPVIILNSASFDCDLKVIPLLRALKNSGKQGKAQQRWRRWGRAKSRIMVKRSFLIGLPWQSTALINSSSQLHVSLKIQTHWSAAVRRAMQLGTLIFVYYYWLQATDEETNNHTCTEHYKILILGSGYRLQGFAVMRTKPCAQLNTIHQNHGSFSSLIFFIGGYQFQGMSHSKLHSFKKTRIFSIVRSDSCSTSSCQKCKNPTHQIKLKVKLLFCNSFYPIYEFNTQVSYICQTYPTLFASQIDPVSFIRRVFIFCCFFSLTQTFQNIVQAHAQSKAVIPSEL